MTLGLASGIRTAQVNALLSAAGANPLMDFYTAPKPATGAAVGGATLLGTVTGGNPFGTVAGPTLTVSACTADADADANGTCGWCRLKTNAGVFVSDLDVGATGSGKEIELDNTLIVQHGTINITGGTITAGNA